MTKELRSFFFIFAFLIMGSFYYSNTIQEPFISLFNSLKTTYHNITKSIQDTIYQHFYQSSHILELQDRLAKYENNHLVMQQLASDISDLYKLNHSNLTLYPQVELVRTISYETFGDLNRLWIDVEDFNSSKIYGLIYKELVAGIVVEKNNKPLAILNKDIKCAYAVYVGDENAPGVAHGNNEKNIVVEYIPSWYNLKIGDEVQTSGLDNIFFKGLKVGKVISIWSIQGYQNVIIAPYYESNEPSYFHIIKKITKN